METKKFSNGQIVQEKNGENLTYFFKNGKIKAEGKSVNDQMEGEWKFYRETGQLWQIGNFEKGVKNGAWIRYDKHDQLEYQETFQNGKIVIKK